MIFTAVKEAQPTEVGGSFVTSEYSPLILFYILRELINVQTTHQEKYGEMILLFDDWSKDYWRKDVYSGYKAHRAGERAKNAINYTEVYEEVNKLVHQLETNLPWRCVTVDKAEADDTILVLSREFSQVQKILIYSPDKDFIQSQRGTDNVDQYSPLTKKWLKPEHKSASMEEWIKEHVILGDKSDGVPKIVDHCEFSDSFIEHLEYNKIPEEFHSVWNFKYGCGASNEVHELTHEQKQAILSTFKVQKKNRKEEDIGIDLYKDTRFGASTLKKALIPFNDDLNAFLDSNPLYRLHYNRNFTLVMEEAIPEFIKEDTMKKLSTADVTYNQESFREYLHLNNLFEIELMLPKVFKGNEISIESVDW